ncbi:hypothetical protein [Legionella pneumophila]|uniref:hypothetical protein n=1 Tax=Legionella pneumophila TaxID=446 RepID=UPI000A6BF0E4|nr:hypothetical protein [Legionella pneumophila]
MNPVFSVEKPRISKTLKAIDTILICPIRRADKSRGFSQKANSQFQLRIKEEVKEALDDIRNESAYKFN